MRPLDGITVVTLEHAIAAPFCTRQLADLGARVIKVERPGVGDFARAYDERVRGQASHFIWTNRSKESLTLDLKHAQAAQILERLLAGADVLVQNLAPGAAARLGLSFEALQPKHPRLIVCDISGYGDDPDKPGPYRDKKAYDLLIQSESGFLSITGTPDESAKAGCSIADIAAGMYGYSGILAALLQRGKTGRGSRIDVSMLESMTEWMSYPLYYAFEGAAPPPRAGAAHATIYPYGPFPTADAKTVMLGPDHRGSLRAFRRRSAGRAARRGWHRQRACEQHERRMGPSAIEGTRALDRGRHARGCGASVAPARRARRLRASHGCRAGARAACRGDSCRAGLCRRRDRKPASRRRNLNRRSVHE